MPKPCILVVHNRYRQPGGEDAVVSSEVALLRRNGHRVLQYSRYNREIETFGPLRKALLAITTTWDHESYSELHRLIRQERPDVVHCHNLLPLLSPAVYYAGRAENVPVVQTVHNFRLLCPGGTFFCDGSVRDECHGRLGGAVLRGCYRGSHLQTAAVALMLAVHRCAGTWRSGVSKYIAPSEFSRSVLLQAGMNPTKVALKPHFVSGVPQPKEGLGEYAIFAGRLSPEKGILELLKVWSTLPIPLLIVGDGPLYAQASRIVHDSTAHHIRFTGQLSHEGTIARIRDARFLIAPSRCYETFGRTVLEAASCGVPAIVSRMGALPELVSEQHTGLSFDVNHHEEMADVVRWAWSHPWEMREMGRAARQNCLAKYSPNENYRQLMIIYEDISTWKLSTVH